MKSIKDKQIESFNELKTQFGYKNILASPRIVKVVVSASTGSLIKKDPKRNEFVADRLSKITGQQPASRAARRSVAGFKIRQGDPIGQTVTLRGLMAESFLDKLLNVALPRTKDFRGISRGAVDEMGNLTIGIPEHTIFPETADEELKDVFGLAVTVVTTASSRQEALPFFEALGIPFKK